MYWYFIEMCVGLKEKFSLIITIAFSIRMVNAALLDYIVSCKIARQVGPPTDSTFETYLFCSLLTLTTAKG